MLTSATSLFGVTLLGALALFTVIRPRLALMCFVSVSYTHLDVYKRQECQGSLHPHDLQEKDGRWQSGSLECQCGQRYPIRDFIPRFVTDDAYVDNFSYEWTIHSKTQIDSRASSRSWTTFFEKTGITPESLRGKRVLDVGVGSGRFADVASKCGADVIGIDLSFSVDAARRTFESRDNVQLVQADVFRLPFRPGTFDFIYSIGVLHHTPDCLSLIHI